MTDMVFQAMNRRRHNSRNLAQGCLGQDSRGWADCCAVGTCLPDHFRRDYCRLVAQFILLIACWTISNSDSQGQFGSTQSPSSSDRVGALPNEALSRALRPDATLRSIYAVSQDRLIAVGDRGTILGTSDAGRSWNLIPCPTPANLHDVKFQGDQGFAVGGWIGTESAQSYGVLLVSNDSGQSWQPIANDLPRLIGLQIIGNNLVCWGDYSSGIGSSVFQSTDRGKSWTAAIPSVSHASTAAADLQGRVAVIDQMGRAKLSTHPATHTISYPHSSLHVLTSIGGTWFAAGENGELITSKDLVNWQNAALPLPTESKRLCDWNCIEQHGATIWLAGSPGSVVLRSSNSGKSWEVLGTGQNLPVHKICFIDQSRGWAVGSLGTILATRDGGNTWYAQRKQPERASSLSIAASFESIPWIAAASTICDQKRTATLTVLQHTEPIFRADAMPSPETQAADSASQLGSAGLNVLDVSTDDESTALARIAVEIAIWRPDVVLTAIDEKPSLSENVPIRSIAKAVRIAASPEFDTIAKPLKLERWQAGKLVSTTNPGQGEYSEDSQRIIQDLGLAIRDVLSCLPARTRATSSKLYMQTTWSRSQSRAAQAELFGGLALQSDSRLTSSLPSLGNYQLVMGRVHRDRALQQLIAADPQASSDEVWLNQLRFYLQSVPESETSEVFVRLTEGLLERQLWRRSDIVLAQLTQNTGDIGVWASKRYLVLSSSHETRDWIGLRTNDADKSATETPVVQTASYQDTWSNSPFSTPEMPSKVSTAGTVTKNAGRVVPTISTDEFNPTHPFATKIDPIQTTPEAYTFGLKKMLQAKRPATNAELLSLVESTIKLHPQLRSHPAIQMLVAANLRGINNMSAARVILNEVANQSHLVGWSQAAKQELAVLDGVERDLKWTVKALSASSIPKLDGVLDESIWQDAEPMQLTSLSSTTTPQSTASQNITQQYAKQQTTTQQSIAKPTEVMWSFDDQYLYVAFRAPRNPGQISLPIAKNRNYDADLKGLDQVELMIDIDRDYGTTIDLIVAENGLTQDRCCGNSAFNPKWHVVILPQADAWQAEIAVRLDSLTTDTPAAGSRWAVSARRIRPVGPPQSWSQLRTHQRLPEASGLLLFE